MIVALSKQIMKAVSTNIKVDPELYDYYQYGIEITISSFFNVGLILLFGMVINNIIAAIGFLACIIPVRQFCGGYHASTYFRCNAIFLLAFLTDYLVAKTFETIDIPINILEALVLIALIPIFLYAPVNNPHKPKDEARDKRCRIISVILSISLSVISLLLCYCSLFYGSLIVITQVTVSVMIILEIVLQRRGIHES